MNLSPTVNRMGGGHCRGQSLCTGDAALPTELMGSDGEHFYVELAAMLELVMCVVLDDVGHGAL